MFTISDTAAARLASRLSKEAQERTFRFVREDHGWRLQLGFVLAGDTIIRHRDKPVLVMDTTVADSLTDRALNLEGTGRDARLRLLRHGR